MITVNEIAKIVNGTVQGNGDVVIKDIKAAYFAREGDLTFAAEEKQLEEAGRSAASCVITSLETRDYPKPVLRVNDMKTSLTMLYNALLDVKRGAKSFIHPTAVIGENSAIGEGTIIEANCVVGNNVTIGKGSRLYANVTIYDRVMIGNNVILHSGAVIGADGFGYIPHDGKILKVPQLGSVIIEDGVEIGANSCVDRGTFTDTVIGAGTKIDNLVQVAHNCKLGRNVIIAGQAGMAGSVTIGDGTMMGGQVGLSDHITIGKNVKIGAQSGVMEKKVPDEAVLFGYPAKDARQRMKEMAFFNWMFKHAKIIMGSLKEKK